MGGEEDYYARQLYRAVRDEDSDEIRRIRGKAKNYKKIKNRVIGSCKRTSYTSYRSAERMFGRRK